VTDQADLERGYRRLLAWYPRAFRRENGPEILAVLMACAPDGRRRPGLAESADLIRNGLRMRLRPSVPRSARTVRAAVGLMYAGAAISTVFLINSVYMIIVLASIDNNKIHHMTLPEVTGALQVPPLSPVAITVGIVGDLAVIAVWLWMARMAGQRRNWARTAAATLFGLATLEISLVAAAPRLLSLTGILGGPALAMLTWPAGAAVVWLLWRPASTAFFKPPDLAPAQPPGFPPGPALPGGGSARTDRP
jgi:hypothetical protein